MLLITSGVTTTGTDGPTKGSCYHQKGRHPPQKKRVYPYPACNDYNDQGSLSTEAYQSETGPMACHATSWHHDICWPARLFPPPPLGDCPSCSGGGGNAPFAGLLSWEGGGFSSLPLGQFCLSGDREKSCCRVRAMQTVPLESGTHGSCHPLQHPK